VPARAAEPCDDEADPVKATDPARTRRSETNVSRVSTWLGGAWVVEDGDAGGAPGPP
jgi:hypothetical protein